MITDTNKLEGISQRFQALATSSQWNDRIYINLRSANRTFRGDSTCKLWHKNDGHYTLERGKGTRSPQFAADLEEVLALLTELGHMITVR